MSAGIVGKLTQGAVDAGFVYVTDVVATDGELKAIELPAKLQPDVAYGAAVVAGASNPAAPATSSTDCSAGDGAAALEQAGFKPAAGVRRELGDSARCCSAPWPWRSAS